MSTKSFGIAYAMRTDPLRVLEEIQRLAVEQLGQVPGALFGPLEEVLNPALDPEERMQFVDQAALRLLRQRHATHVMNFRQQIALGFDQFRARRPRAARDLGLVNEKQLEFQLAGQRVAESVEQRHARALQMMDGRLRSLGLELGLPQALNPVGPERLAAAFMETFGEEAISEALRVLMFREYDVQLERVLGELYTKINNLLAASGYAVAETQAPAPERVMAPAADAAARAPDAASGDSGGSAGATADSAGPGREAPPHVELRELREMLHAWRRAAPPVDAAPGHTGTVRRPGGVPTRPQVRRPLRPGELRSVASLLQSEPTDSFARALAGTGRLAGVIRDQLNFGSRRLGLDPDKIQLSGDEEDAIDLVALLFESLFQSHRLPERSRRLYARLVLPYIKVALGDQSMFVQSAHPARRLLDAITEACAGNTAETPQERELLERAAAAAQHVVAEYNEDLAIFEAAHSELDALLQQQRHRIELQEDRAAKATSGRERLALAREQADAMVALRLAGAPLSRAVADFLATPWRYHLVQTLLREGAHAQTHLEAVSLGDALVDIDRLAAGSSGRQLAQQLIALEPAIVACLASSGLDRSAAEQALATLVHGLAHPDEPRELRPLPPAESNGEEVQERKLWLAGGTDTVAHDPALAERMRQLRPGDLLKLVDAQGDSMPAKVAWISPLTTRVLLVNRRGLRVLLASAEELAALAGSGRLVLGGELAAFDEALRHVRQHLTRNAA